FAGLVLLPTLRRGDLSWRPLMLVMMTSFAIMNATFVTALALGPAANAIVLQYTAPMWMYLASIWWLGEPADGRSSTALGVGLVGIGIIFIGGGQEEGQLPIVGLALVSGLGYAGVLLCLRVLREASPRWLTVLNHLCAGVVLLPFIYALAAPTALQ